MFRVGGTKSQVPGPREVMEQLPGTFGNVRSLGFSPTSGPVTGFDQWNMGRENEQVGSQGLEKQGVFCLCGPQGEAHAHVAAASSARPLNDKPTREDEADPEPEPGQAQVHLQVHGGEGNTCFCNSLGDGVF